MEKKLHIVLVGVLGIFLTSAGYVVGSVRGSAAASEPRIVEKVVEKEIVTRDDLAKALSYLFEADSASMFVRRSSFYSSGKINYTQRFSLELTAVDSELSTKIEKEFAEADRHVTFLEIVNEIRALQENRR